MAVHNVGITVDLNALLGSLRRSLQDTIDFVSAGLIAVPALPQQDLRIPEAFFQFFPLPSEQRRGMDEVKSEYSTWALRCGFREHIESLSQFLEEARRVCAIYSLNMLDEVRGENWNEAVVEETGRFHWLGLPRKLEHFQREYGIEVELSAEVKSINHARNCLVHRRGIVSTVDINEENKLVVRWRRMELFAEGQTGERVLVKGAVVEGAEQVGVRSSPVSKSFATGEPITFTAQEFSEVGLTIFLFGQDLTKKVEEYGRKCGIRFREPDNAELRANL